MATAIGAVNKGGHVGSRLKSRYLLLHVQQLGAFPLHALPVPLSVLCGCFSSLQALCLACVCECVQPVSMVASSLCLWLHLACVYACMGGCVL